MRVKSQARYTLIRTSGSVASVSFSHGDKIRTILRMTQTVKKLIASFVV